MILRSVFSGSPVTPDHIVIRESILPCEVGTPGGNPHHATSRDGVGVERCISREMTEPDNKVSLDIGVGDVVGDRGEFPVRDVIQEDCSSR